MIEKGGEAEWERESLNDAENWPMTAVHQSSQQLAVNLSVPVSSHLTRPTPPVSNGLPHVTLTPLLLQPHIQNFHLRARVTVNNGLRLSVFSEHRDGK